MMKQPNPSSFLHNIPTKHTRSKKPFGAVTDKVRTFYNQNPEIFKINSVGVVFKMFSASYPDANYNSFCSVYYRIMQDNKIPLLGQQPHYAPSDELDHAVNVFSEIGNIPINQRFLDDYGIKMATAYKAKQMVFGSMPVNKKKLILVTVMNRPQGILKNTDPNLINMLELLLRDSGIQAKGMSLESLAESLKRLTKEVIVNIPDTNSSTPVKFTVIPSYLNRF